MVLENHLEGSVILEIVVNLDSLLLDHNLLLGSAAHVVLLLLGEIIAVVHVCWLFVEKVGPGEIGKFGDGVVWTRERLVGEVVDSREKDESKLRQIRLHLTQSREVQKCISSMLVFITRHQHHQVFAKS